MIVRPFLPILAAASLLAPQTGLAQTTSGTASAAATPAFTTLTALTRPTTAWLRFDGPSRIQGPAPLELPPSLQGRFSLVVEGANVARTQGVLYIPARGAPAKLLSESRALSGGLLIRSLSYPGVPDITAKRPLRGGLLATAATGGLVASGFAHFRYRDRLDEFGAQAGDRAQDERKSRNSWAKFAGATYGLSVLDYWIRPRLAIEESTPSRITISVPTLSRGGILWRSVLVPGAGQDYANQRVRGALWLGAALSAAAGFVVADGIVERDQTDVDWAQATIDSAGSGPFGPTEQLAHLERLHNLEAKRNDLQSSEDLRRGFRYAMIGVYLANILDAFLVPTHGPAGSAVQEPRVSTSVIPLAPSGPSVQVTYRF
jgi:hypothetical protein